MKLRVWWVPDVPGNIMYFPVNSPEEGNLLIESLGLYDMFLLDRGIRDDYCNAGGLEMYDEENGEWIDWYLETEDEYYDDLEDYVEAKGIKRWLEIADANEWS